MVLNSEQAYQVDGGVDWNGVGGAISTGAGAAIGAKIGASFGTAACPGLGTAVGGIIGGAAGYFIYSFGIRVLKYLGIHLINNKNYNFII